MLYICYSIFIVYGRPLHDLWPCLLFDILPPIRRFDLWVRLDGSFFLHVIRSRWGCVMCAPCTRVVPWMSSTGRCRCGPIPDQHTHTHTNSRGEEKNRTSNWLWIKARLTATSREFYFSSISFLFSSVSAAVSSGFVSVPPTIQKKTWNDINR